MANKFKWRDLTAPSFGDVNALMDSYAKTQERIPGMILDPLMQELDKNRQIGLQNSQSEMNANTGALIEAIRNGKNPERTGLYNSNAVADAAWQYKKWAAQEARAKAAAARAASNAKRKNALNAKLASLTAGALKPITAEDIIGGSQKESPVMNVVPGNVTGLKEQEVSTQESPWEGPSGGRFARVLEADAASREPIPVGSNVTANDIFNIRNRPMDDTTPNTIYDEQIVDSKGNVYSDDYVGDVYNPAINAYQTERANQNEDIQKISEAANDYNRLGQVAQVYSAAGKNVPASVMNAAAKRRKEVDDLKRQLIKRPQVAQAKIDALQSTEAIDQQLQRAQDEINKARVHTDILGNEVPNNTKKIIKEKLNLREKQANINAINSKEAVERNSAINTITDKTLLTKKLQEIKDRATNAREAIKDNYDESIKLTPTEKIVQEQQKEAAKNKTAIKKALKIDELKDQRKKRAKAKEIMDQYDTFDDKYKAQLANIGVENGEDYYKYVTQLAAKEKAATLKKKTWEANLKKNFMKDKYNSSDTMNKIMDKAKVLYGKDIPAPDIDAWVADEGSNDFLNSLKDLADTYNFTNSDVAEFLFKDPKKYIDATDSLIPFKSQFGFENISDFKEAFEKYIKGKYGNYAQKRKNTGEGGVASNF